MIYRSWLSLFFWPIVLGLPSFQADRARQLEQLKEKILSDLGFSRLPDISRANVTRQQMEIMKRAYRRSVKDDREDQRKTKLDQSPQRFYTFKDNAWKNDIPNKYHLFFPINISESRDVVKNANLHSAKLYVYKNKVPWYRLSTTATVKIYQVMEPYNKYSAETVLLEIRNVVFDVGGWEVFDVTDSVSMWLEKPSRNFGLQLECEDCDKKLSAADDRRPYLDMWITESPWRSKRSKALENKFQSSVLDCSQGRDSDLCCKHSMWVSFADIGWEWIVQPSGFEAYYCRGKCPHDYNNYASTHALIQSIFNYHRSRDVPPPCCVPKRLKPLNLLHFNDKDPPELIITKQMGMIVQECACS